MVAIGGGTGLSVVLRGLKPHVGTDLAELTAVVTVSDDGGSSGRLRRDFAVLPPGDVRSCLVALADDEDLLSRLFEYRFPGEGGLAGHSFGNLFLTALAGITGDFHRAILTAEEVLSVRGRILPAALEPITLRGHGGSGAVYEGESQVGRRGEALGRLELVPPDPAAFPPAVEAIERHLGGGWVDAVLVNSAPLAARRLRAYAREGSEPVAIDGRRLAARGVEVAAADLLDDGDLVRHDPRKLARSLLAFATARSGADRGAVR